MKMNLFERLMVSSRLRRLIQARVELPAFIKMGAHLQCRSVLEIGCGSGHATKAISSTYGASRAIGVDLDDRLIQRATKNQGSALFAVADANHLPFPDSSFDVVAEFAAFHHVEDWRSAVKEAVRVLRPGGQILFEDITKKGLTRWVYKVCMVHPDKDRFSAEEFISELTAHHVHVSPCRWEPVGDFFFGIGKKLG